MTNTETLESAIRKAWPDVIEIAHKPDGGILIEYKDKDVDCLESVEQLIFDHGFAKAFWGEVIVSCPCVGSGYCDKCGEIAWQYHLKQMVLEPSPIKYLERFL